MCLRSHEIIVLRRNACCNISQSGSILIFSCCTKQLHFIVGLAAESLRGKVWRVTCTGEKAECQRSPQEASLSPPWPPDCQHLHVGGSQFPEMSFALTTTCRNSVTVEFPMYEPPRSPFCRTCTDNKVTSLVGFGLYEAVVT